MVDNLSIVKIHTHQRGEFYWKKERKIELDSDTDFYEKPIYQQASMHKLIAINRYKI